MSQREFSSSHDGSPVRYRRALRGRTGDYGALRARAFGGARPRRSGDIRPRCLPRRLSEISRKNKSFSSIQNRGDMRLSDASTRIHESVAPREGEPVVTKLRVSAFAGSDLEVLLRSMGIDSLVLSGIATSGVVLSTLREAADKDYRLTVLSDACLDADAEVGVWGAMEQENGTSPLPLSNSLFVNVL